MMGIKQLKPLFQLPDEKQLANAEDAILKINTETNTLKLADGDTCGTVFSEYLEYFAILYHNFLS